MGQVKNHLLCDENASFLYSTTMPRHVCRLDQECSGGEIDTKPLPRDKAPHLNLDDRDQTRVTEKNKTVGMYGRNQQIDVMEAQ